MASTRRFALLGTHTLVTAAGREDGVFDAFDVVVELDSVAQVVFGVRTVGFLEGRNPVPWDDGYEPLPVTLDLTTVNFFDFDEILWLGPEPRKCLVWSNAVGLEVAAIEHLASPRPGSRLMDGHEGLGLPTPDELGVQLPPSAVWYDASRDPLARVREPSIT